MSRDFFTSGRVPHAVAIAASAAIHVIGDHINAYPDVRRSDGEGKVGRAPAEHADGFWSWNNGGFTFDAAGRISVASEYDSVPGAARWLVDQYDAGHVVGSKPMNSAGEELDVDAPDFDDEDIDRDWLDGTYRYEVRIFAKGADTVGNETDEDELILTVGVNPYEPGEQGSWTYHLIDRVMKLSEVTSDSLDAFAKEAVAALDVDRTRAGAQAFNTFNAARKAEKQAADAASRAYWSKGASA